MSYAQQTFSKALEHLKAGEKVGRLGWNGKGLWLELQRPDAHSKMTLPYIFISYPRRRDQHAGRASPLARLADRPAGRGLGDRRLNKLSPPRAASPWTSGRSCTGPFFVYSSF